jgi:hypothetical protein
MIVNHRIDYSRTLSARFFTRYDIGPVILRVRAWAWLAADMDDLVEKMRCLEAIVALDSDLEWARAALEDMRYRWTQMT